MRYKELQEAREDFYIPKVQQSIDKKGLSEYFRQASNLYPGESEAEKLVNYFKELDPTAKNQYLGWIVKIWQNGSLKQEDAYKVTDYLDLFNQAKKANKLQGNQKDINQYKSLEQLYSVIEQYREETLKSKRQLKKDEVDRMFREDQAELAYSDEHFWVVIPKTEEASCFFGKGTEWCTAATKSHNYFKRYADKGTLYIILIRNSPEKYQFYMEKGIEGAVEYVDDFLFDRIPYEYQDEEDQILGHISDYVHDYAGDAFTDQNDKSVDAKKLLDKHPYLLNFQPLWEFMTLYDPGFLIKHHYKTLDKYQIGSILEIQPESIKWLKNPTKQQRMTAVKRDGFALEHLDDPSYQEILAALKNSSPIIRAFPEFFRKKKKVLKKILTSPSDWQYLAGPPTTRLSSVYKWIIEANLFNIDDHIDVLENHPKVLEGLHEKYKNRLLEILSKHGRTDLLFGKKNED